jgi:hypothetical protein
MKYLDGNNFEIGLAYLASQPSETIKILKKIYPELENRYCTRCGSQKNRNKQYVCSTRIFFFNFKISSITSTFAILNTVLSGNNSSKYLSY